MWNQLLLTGRNASGFFRTISVHIYIDSYTVKDFFAPMRPPRELRMVREATVPNRSCREATILADQPLALCGLGAIQEMTARNLEPVAVTVAECEGHD